jgi:hypothetical protein
MKTLSSEDILKISKKKKRSIKTKKDIIGFDVMGGAESFPVTKDSLDILETVDTTFAAAASFRRQTERSDRYYKGDQWKDKVVIRHRDGTQEVLTEEEYIERQGRPALKLNLIRPLIVNVIGQLRQNAYKSTIFSRTAEGQKAADMLTAALEGVHAMNNKAERDARLFEGFLVSGAAIYNTGYKFDDEKKTPFPYYKAVDPSRYFQTVNASDVCGDDIDFCGDFFDTSILDIKSMYAKTRKQEKELEEIYGNISGRRDVVGNQPFVDSNAENLSPRISLGSGECRVIRVCRKEGHWDLAVHDYSDASWETYNLKTHPHIKAEIDAEIARRKKIAKEIGVDYEDGSNRLLIEYEEKFVTSWVYYHLSPWGHILWTQDSPYDHNSHSYVAKFHTMFRGQVYGMVYDLIDPQKSTNRNFIMHDFITGAAAKGVLLVPEEAIPDDMDLEDIADEWSRYNGVIKYRAKDGVKQPEQVVARNFNVGQFDMMNMQMKLMHDISGVHDAAQGKSLGTGTPSSLYQQAVQNSHVNVLDYMESFAWLLSQRDYKMVQIIKQFYTDSTPLPMAGKSGQTMYYDPALVRMFDYFNEISKGNDTPVARLYLDTMLFQLLQQRLITLEMYLEESKAPFSDSLLQKVRAAQQQAAAGQMPSQEQIAEMQQAIPQSNNGAMEQLQQMLYGQMQ